MIAAGLAGNYFRLPLFLDVDILFGSIFAMLALQFCGRGRGILAASIIASCTYFIWNQPYAIIVQTLEVAVVAFLMDRRKKGMVLADTIYWLLIGMPLAYLFFHVVMHVPFSNAFIVVIKQALNGIANALVARLIFTGHAFWSRSSLLPLRETIYNLMTFFVLSPVLIMLVISSRTDFAETDRHIRAALMQDRQYLGHSLANWVEGKKTALADLAEMAASRSPQQIQAHLEQAKKSDADFLRVGLLDRTATTTAYFPLVDELGKDNIGKNFADRPFLPQLKRTLKPLLSEVFMGRIGIPKPIVSMLVPVLIKGKFDGYVIGVLDLAQLQNRLSYTTSYNTALYTLIDKNGNVIMTNRTDQKIMTPFMRDKGKINSLDAEISQWVPVVPLNTPITERWRKSFYVTELTIGNLAEWKLILEQPIAPFQKSLHDNYSEKLSLLFMILLGSLALAEFLSRKIVVTLERLQTITNELPARLAMNSKEIDWPVSRLYETNHLISYIREMANLLSDQLHEVRQINESLEQRVEERTEDLRCLNLDFVTFLESTSDFVYFKDKNSRFRFCSQTLANITGHSSWRDMLGKHDLEVFPKDTARINFEEELPVFRDGIALLNKISLFYDAQGSQGWVSTSKWPMLDSENRVTGIFGISRDITESKQAVEVLKTSEKRFRSIMENIPSIAVQGYALDGTLFFWNRASELLYGFSVEEALESNVLDLIIPPDTRERAAEAIQKMKETGEPVPTGEWLLKRKDGTCVPVFARHFMINPIGQQTEYYCLSIDLTEKKRLEDLSQARTSLREYARSHSLDELMSKTLDDVEALTGSTIGFFHFIGDDQQTLLLQTWSSNTLSTMCSSEGKGQHYSVDEAGVWVDCIRQRQPVIHNDYASLPHRKWMPQGHAEVVRELVVPIFRNDMIVGVIGVGNKPADYVEQDIETVSRLANLTWDIVAGKRVKEELYNSEERLRLVLKGSNDAPWDWNFENNLFYFSPRWWEMLGYAPDELPSGTTLWKSILHPDDVRIFNTTLKHGADTFEAELRLRHKAGHFIPVLSRGSILRDACGNAVRVAGVNTDLTKPKRVLEELLQARIAAESANKAKSQFLANMSHEIRTPMNGVFGMIQLMEMTGLTEEQQEYLADLRLSANNLLLLINDILDLSKIEAGNIAIEEAEFSLHNCIKDIVMAQKYSVHQKILSVDMDLSGDIPPALMGDRLRITQILNNLLGNAVKFTPRGNITIATRIIEQLGSSVLVQVAVRDTGIGISPEALDKIFMPFIQENGSTTRTYGGTGLGLTISRRLTELMGGSITVESSPNIGSCFKVTLPFSVVQTTDTVAEAPNSDIIKWDAPALRILFADDNLINTKLGMTMLKKLGHSAFSVVNGKDCLEALEQGTFDLVLMDIQMPVMTGEEALRVIRGKEQGTFLHQPVIALTAFALSGEKKRFLEEGFDGYISKPYEIKEVVNEIKRVMVIT